MPLTILRGTRYRPAIVSPAFQSRPSSSAPPVRGGTNRSNGVCPTAGSGPEGRGDGSAGAARCRLHRRRALGPALLGGRRHGKRRTRQPGRRPERGRWSTVRGGRLRRPRMLAAPGPASEADDGDHDHEGDDEPQPAEAPGAAARRGRSGRRRDRGRRHGGCRRRGRDGRPTGPVGIGCHGAGRRLRSGDRRGRRRGERRDRRRAAPRRKHHQRQADEDRHQQSQPDPNPDQSGACASDGWSLPRRRRAGRALARRSGHLRVRLAVLPAWRGLDAWSRRACRVRR